MGNNKFKILIIEDDHVILNFVQTLLEANSYQILTAERGDQGWMVFSSHRPDLVILDLGLPDMDGEEFIHQIRQNNMTPIIVLSARSDEHDKVSALDLGANDYITKPFGTAELLARVRACLRSSQFSNSIATLPSGKFIAGDLEIDFERRIVTAAGEQIPLTQTEYNILTFLSKHAGKVLTYSTIICEIWGSTDSGSIKKLQVNMANIRKKLKCVPGDNKYFINELGVGYRMLDE